MSKAILLLLALLLIYWIFIHDKVSARRDPTGKSEPPRTEKMVACARCGIHVPESDAISDAGLYYCSEEHRKLGTS